MNKIETEIENLYILENFYAQDNRGSFTKLYNETDFNNLDLPMEIKEVFYSTSNKDVVRGLHFQLPPFDHEKIVTVIRGEVEDVIIDLRKNSKSYGKIISIMLSESDNKAVYIPKGCAHGFKTILDNTVMLYMVTTGHNKEYDSGIKWNSIDFDWNIKEPIVSDKDENLVEFKNFNSPF